MKMPRVRVAGVLVKDNKILFIKHKKEDSEYWLLPGGGLDYGETFQIALKREFNEETNLEVDVKEMLYISESISPTGSRHIVNIYFNVEYLSGEIILGDEKILEELKFLGIDEIKDSIIYPNTKKNLLDLLENGLSEIKYLGNRWD